MHSILALHVCHNIAVLLDSRAASQCSHIYYPKAIWSTVVLVHEVDMSVPVCRCCCLDEDLRLFMLEGCCLLPWLRMLLLRSTECLGLQNNY